MGVYGSWYYVLDNLECCVVLDSVFFDIGNVILLMFVNSYVVKKYLKEINGYFVKINYFVWVKFI